MLNNLSYLNIDKFIELSKNRYINYEAYLKTLRDKVKIVWLGFHEEGRYCLDSLYEAGFEISTIITLDDEEIAKRAGAFNYEVLAKKYDIPIKKIRHINDEQSVELLTTLQPDILFVIGWSQILNEATLSSSKWVVGAHASKLPENRGSAPINWSLIKGESYTGNSLIELLPGVDTGDILGQQTFEISNFDSCKTLYEKVARSNAEMVVQFCDSYLSENIKTRKQTNLNAPILPRRKPEHGEINWEQSSESVYNFIRALTRPYPGAFFYKNGDKCIVWNCSWNSSLKEQFRCGEILSINYSFEPKNCGVNIGCATGSITIHELEVNSKVLVGEELIKFLS